MDNRTFKIILENYSLQDADQEKKSWKRLAEELGFTSKDAIRKQFYREFAKQQVNDMIEDVTEQPLTQEEPVLSAPYSGYKESIEIKADGSYYSDRLVDIFNVDLKNPASLLQVHGFDPDKWLLVSAKNNLWGNKYQSKISVKPKVEEKSKKEFGLEDIDTFFKNFNNPVSPKVSSPKQYSRNGKILEIDLADLHVGNMSVREDDLPIQAKLRYVVDEIIDRIGNTEFEKILLVNLGDLFHYDTYKQTTTSGTPITSDMDIYSMFDLGTSMMIETVNRLAEIAPVEMIGIYGNHDKTLSYTAMKAIEFYYRNSDSVTVDAGHSPRKYRRFGNCLIGFCHGDLPKTNVPTLLQREARKDYGETKYAEIHLGHFHSLAVDDKDGVIVRYLPTITPTDSWHNSEGYSGALKSTSCFVWDTESGLKEMWFVNL